MGCSQSKTTSNQIVERASVDIPGVEAPGSASVSAHDVAVEAPLVTAEGLPPAPTSVPVEVSPRAVKSAVEDEAEKSSNPVEEESADLAQEVPLSKSAASEDVLKTQEPVKEQAPVSTKKISDEEAGESEAIAPALQPIVKEEESVEEEATKSESAVKEEASVEAPKSESAAKEEPSVEAPKSEVTAITTVGETKPVGGGITFTALDVTFNDKGVAFYNYDGSDASNPASDVHVSKRYSEFKALHAQLSDSQEYKTLDLPTLPKASFLQNRKNKKMLEERKVQFLALLNAAASHSIASQSDVFKAFLA